VHVCSFFGETREPDHIWCDDVGEKNQRILNMIEKIPYMTERIDVTLPAIIYHTGRTK